MAWRHPGDYISKQSNHVDIRRNFWMLDLLDKCSSNEINQKWNWADSVFKLTVNNPLVLNQIRRTTM